MGARGVNGAALLVSALKCKGVDQVFSLNGGHIADIYKACVDCGVRILDVRHEEAAAHMAYGYARITGRPAVVLVTAGPGVTNTVTGVATAHQAATPMIVLGGRSPTPQMGMGALQEMDQVGVMRPVTKCAETVQDARRIPMWVNRAFQMAMGGKPGPVFLDFPTEVLRQPVDPALLEEVSGEWAPLPPAPDPGAVAAAAAMLREAERPLVVAGGGVLFSGATPALIRLAGRLGVPVLTTSLNRGVFPGDHPLHVAGARSLAMGKADLVLLLGARLNFVLAYGRPPRFAADARFIHVDVEATEIGRNRKVDLGVVADARRFLAALDAATAGDGHLPGRYGPWVQCLQERDRQKRAALEASLDVPDSPVHPLRLCKEVRDLLTDDTVLVLDGGDILSYGRMVLTRNRPGTYVDPGPFGTMGVGVSCAIAARLACPKAPVIALVGDGAFGLNFMEMDTAVRHNLPIVVVVSNNGGWNIERQALGMDFGPEYMVGTSLNQTRYDLMVQALGGHGEFVTRPEEIRPAIERALASGRAACVNVLTAADVVSPDLARGLARIPAEQALYYQAVE